MKANLIKNEQFSTSTSWPRIIKSFNEDLGPFVSLRPILFNQRVVKAYTVFCPAERWGNRKSEAKLLVCNDDYLHVYHMDSTSKNILKIAHSFNKHLLYERKKALLYSYIRIISLEDEMQVESLIEFNAVAIRIFKPIIDRLRLSKGNGIEDTNIQAIIDTMDYRCQNILIEDELNSHTIKAMLYQTMRIRFLFGLFKQIQSLPKLILITQTEWITIQLGERLKWGVSFHEETYTYIPLHIIKNLHINQDKSMTLISVHSAEDQLLKSIEFELASVLVSSHSFEELEKIVQKLNPK